VAEFGPGDAAAKKKLADTLIARKQDLLARFPAATKATKKALDPSALPVDPKSIPKPHDFENWNGPGKGLSSKDYVNKSNAVVEFQMQALAQAGNLTALRQFKFPAINKDTGQPTGEMIPVEKHPSKHVQQYHQDLMQVLDEVANPPEPLKVFRETEIGTLEALDAAFPPKPFGTTVKKAASNEKLGFWVALGAVKNPSKFAPKTTRHYSTKDIAAAKEKYDKASKLAKHFISSVQASGSYNDLFRDGKTHDNAGNSLQDVAKAASRTPPKCRRGPPSTGGRPCRRRWSSTSCPPKKGPFSRLLARCAQATTRQPRRVSASTGWSSATPRVQKPSSRSPLVPSKARRRSPPCRTPGSLYSAGRWSPTSSTATRPATASSWRS